MRATMGRQLYNQTTGTAFLYVKQEGKRQTSAIVYLFRAIYFPILLCFMTIFQTVLSAAYISPAHNPPDMR